MRDHPWRDILGTILFMLMVALGLVLTLAL